jgi:hypothetical protein
MGTGVDVWFFVIVGAILLVVGGLAATWWWKLAQRAAPYEDELSRPKKPEHEGADVIVIKGLGGTGSGGDAPAGGPPKR